MITELPLDVAIGLFLGFLIVALLGAAVGYFLASRHATQRADSDVQNMQSEMTRTRTEADTELRLLSNENSEFQTSLRLANERAASAIKQKESLELQAQFLAQRIQSLEAQVSSYEEQQTRLEREFVRYKSDKIRELLQAKLNSEPYQQTGHLPILNKRVADDDSFAPDVISAEQQRARTPLHVSRQSDSERVRTDSRVHPSSNNPDKLTLPLSQEWDIPALAESELPDSVEDLEFELLDLVADSGNSRG